MEDLGREISAQSGKRQAVGVRSLESRSEVIPLGFKSWLCRLKAECSLGTYLTSLSLSFFIYKMGAITIQTCEIEMSQGSEVLNTAPVRASGPINPESTSGTVHRDNWGHLMVSFCYAMSS